MMYLPRDEIAFRKQYEQLVANKRLTTVFRPGNRIYPRWRGYKLGEQLTARIIEQCGSDQKGIAPLFNAIKIPVCVRDIQLRHIDTLKLDDFSGSSPDVFDRQSLKEHLYFIYGKTIDHFAHQVTVIHLDYSKPSV